MMEMQGVWTMYTVVCGGDGIERSFISSAFLEVYIDFIIYMQTLGVYGFAPILFLLFFHFDDYWSKKFKSFIHIHAINIKKEKKWVSLLLLICCSLHWIYVQQICPLLKIFFFFFGVLKDL